VSELTPEVLLSGPRGRRLCLAVAHRLHEPVWSALLQAAHTSRDLSPQGRLLDQLNEVEVGQVSTWLDPTQFVPSVAESVNRAMYWQEPDEEDVLAATPEVADTLAPIAAAICASPAAAWWNSPVDLEHLRYTDRYDASHRDEPARPPHLSNAATKLAAWHADADKGSSRWWSAPLGEQLPWTTRPLPGLGSTELVWEEDTLGHPSARVWHLTAAAAPRVYEIDSPTAWTALVAQYPLDVTHSNRDEWRQVTGLDGPWLVPDYQAVAHDWDGVHLTVAGYLATATRALPLPQHGHTLLGGWDPDATWWLNDTLNLASAEPRLWHLNRDDQDQITWDAA
jgi:hypothetical protein